MSALTESPAWQALAAHRHEMDALKLRDLFRQDPGRTAQFSASACGLSLDYSCQRLTAHTLELLLDLAHARQVEEGIAAMFAGYAINPTESRAALHVALRNFNEAGHADWPLQAKGEAVMDDVAGVLTRMAQFCQAVHTGKWRGYSERMITDVVNIGIGGSDLGPRLVYQALQCVDETLLRAHYVSNVDPLALDQVLVGLRPESTLFVVTSKTFTTAETMANAEAARAWFVEASGDEAAIRQHFVAVSTNLEATRAFGIPADNTFGFWDWVGGRYSLWSSVGLSVALAMGMDKFRDLLAGAHAMDQHFRQAPMAENLPILMALVGIWNVNFLRMPTQAIIPYSEALKLLPAYLQQLEMESNGKSVDRDGKVVDYQTAPVLWGGVGTDVQHAFFQQLHQGPQAHPVDFILPLTGRRDGRQRQLVANCLAQAEALMRGKDAGEVRTELSQKGLSGEALEAAIPHRVFPGNRPSSCLVMEELIPATLGAMLALYEHKTYVQGLVWNICSFDQWGVELGKQLAGRVLAKQDAEPQLRPQDVLAALRQAP
jgi:glucose-6-phosphate isomerase